jgi:hypothetical protein
MEGKKPAAAAAGFFRLMAFCDLLKRRSSSADDPNDFRFRAALS